jgi:hypothetical protein
MVVVGKALDLIWAKSSDRAGLIDPKFRKTKKYKGAIDSPIQVNRRYVLQSIDVLEELAKKVETILKFSPTHTFNYFTLR